MINLGSAYGEILIGTGEAERSVSTLASSMRKVGGAMSLAISAPLAAIGAVGLNAAADFEQSLNVMQQVSGATESAMASLQAQALQLGADTSFSAGEAAEGMLELAKAGFDTEQTMGAISGVLALAAAGGLSVAQAAEISANAINSFNLPAGEATRVADLLAAAANSSSVEVTDMALAFQMSASVFASNKQSIDDLSTAIALLGNNGLKGSDAGTSLKTMLMRLTAPTDEASVALSDLGIQVYNADGSMRGFENIVSQLETATSTLTDAQRNQALTTIFGADAIRAANILIGEGSDEFGRMKDAVNQAGAASETANARMGGLRGAIEYARGTIESTLIDALLPLTDGIGTLVRQAADLIGSFSSLSEPVRNAALAFAAVLAVVGPLLVAIPMVAGVLGALLSPIGLVVVGVAALAAAWAANFGGIQEKTAAVVTTVTQALRGIVEPVSWVAQAMLDAGVNSIEASEAITALPAALRLVARAFQTVYTALATGAARLKAVFGPAVERVRQVFAGLPAALGTLSPPIQGVLSAFVGLWAALQPILRSVGGLLTAVFAVTGVTAVNGFAQVIEVIVPIVRSMMGQLALTLNTLADLLRTAVALFTAVVNGDWKTANEVLGGIGETMVKFLEGTWANMRDALGSITRAIADVIVQTLSDMGIDVSVVFGGIAAWLQAMLPAALSTLQGLWTAVWPALQNAVATAWAVIRPAFSAAWTWLQVNLPVAVSWLQTTWAATWLTIQDAVTTAWSAIQPALAGAWAWLQVNLPAAVASLQTIWNAAWPVIQSAVVTAWNVIAPALAGAWAWLQVTLPVAIGVLQSLWETAWPAISGAVQAAWNAIAPPLSAAWGWLQINLPIALNALQGSWNSVWPALQSAVTSAWGVIEPAFTALQGALHGLPTAVNGVQAPLAGLWMQITAIGAQIGAFFAPAMGRVQEAFAGLPAGLAPLLPKLQELGAAFGGLLQAIQPLVVVIGAGLAIAANFGVNLFAAAIGNLPGIVGPIIDQVTATIGLISTVISKVTTAIVAIATGDWATAWDSLKSIVTAFQTFVSDTWTNITTTVSNVGGAIGEAVTNTLSDLGLDAAAATVQSIIDKVTELGTKLTGVLSGSESFTILLPDWLTDLLDWTWPELAATAVSWLADLFEWIWPTLPASPVQWLANLFGWAWPSFPALPGWVDSLMNWDWPTFDMPEWLDNLFNFEWPSLPTISLPGFASGTNYAPRGLALVGERGPELIDLQGGERIYDAQDTGRLLSGSAGPQIVINATVSNDLDIHRLAHQVLSEWKRWGRR